MGDEGAEAARVGVRDGGEGEDESHQDGGPGEFVVGGEGEVSHVGMGGSRLRAIPGVG